MLCKARKDSYVFCKTSDIGIPCKATRDSVAPCKARRDSSVLELQATRKIMSSMKLDGTVTFSLKVKWTVRSYKGKQRCLQI